MTEPLSEIPKGLQYHSDAEARLRRRIEEIAMSVFEGWSYQEISTPTIDYYSLFERGMGPSESHRAFRFADADGRLLALRPDVTSGIARAAATLFTKRPRPLRLCYAARVFRQQGKSHTGWRREATQIGCELIGCNSVTADMEVLAIACEVLRRLGLDRSYVITLNDIEVFNGIAEPLAFNASSRDELRRLVDSRNLVDLESFLAEHAALADYRAFSQLIRLSGRGETLERACRVITNQRSGAALERLKNLWAIIEALSFSDLFEIDLSDVSRLDYYTGLTFKIYVEGAGTWVGSGGRYDNLTSNFGAAEPAIGFVLDLEALTSLMSSVNKVPGLDDQGVSRVQTIFEPDQTQLFRTAIQRRAMDECVLIGSGGGGE